MALTVREYLNADGKSPFREWSQATDIARARGFWRDYLEAKRHGKAT
jgi:hypothetical protein